MLDSVYGCKSEAWNNSGLLCHFASLLKSRVRTLSMSMTVVLPIRSIARLEYSVAELANNRKRPRLIIGATAIAADASAVCFSKSRLLVFIGLICGLTSTFHFHFDG